MFLKKYIYDKGVVDRKRIVCNYLSNKKWKIIKIFFFFFTILVVKTILSENQQSIKKTKTKNERNF